MTKEEIEKAVDELFHRQPPDTFTTDFDGKIMPARVYVAVFPQEIVNFALHVVRTTYREAIEEAAKAVEDFKPDVWRCPHGREIQLTGCQGCLADQVRRLIEEKTDLEEMKPKTDRR